MSANSDATQAGVTNPARGTVQMLVARVFLLVSGFGVATVLARYLGPTSFGVYGVVMSFVVWFERIAGGGIPRGTTTLLSQAPEQRAVIEQSTRVLLTALTVPVFVLVWIFAPTIAASAGLPDDGTLIRIAALNLPAMALFFTYESVFSGLHMFAAQSKLLIVQSVAKLVGIAILLLVGLSVTSAFVAHVAATALAIVWAAARSPLTRALPSVSIMRQMIELAVPLGTYLAALMLLINLSLWQLQGSGIGADEVGFYVASINVTRLMMVVPSAVSVVLYPSLIQALSTSRHDLATKYVQGAVRFAFILVVPACVLLAVDASDVMALLFGSEFAPGGRVLSLLCVAFSLVALLDVLLNALMAAGGLLRSVAVLALLIPVLYVLNALWIPEAGAVGAAAASAVSLAMGVAASVAFTYRRFGSPLPAGTLARVAGASVVVGTISMLVPAAGIWLLMKLAVLGVAYIALLRAIGEITTRDLKPFALWKTERAG